MEIRRRLLALSAKAKNLLDISGTPTYYRSSGGVYASNFTVTNNTITVTGNAQAGWLTDCEIGKTYEYTIETDYTGGTRLAMRVYYSSTPLEYIPSTQTYDNTYVSGAKQSMTFTVPIGANYVYVGFYADSRIAGTTITNMTVF